MHILSTLEKTCYFIWCHSNVLPWSLKVKYLPMTSKEILRKREWDRDQIWNGDQYEHLCSEFKLYQIKKM